MTWDGEGKGAPASRGDWAETPRHALSRETEQRSLDSDTGRSRGWQGEQGACALAFMSPKLTHRGGVFCEGLAGPLPLASAVSLTPPSCL